METKIFSNRKGSVKEQDVVFNVTADFNNGVVFRAVGTFQSSKHHKEFSGVLSTLIDKETGFTFPILISDTRFTFNKYDGIEKF